MSEPTTRAVPATGAVGRSIPRPDADAKVRGAAVYTVDLSEAGTLHAAVLRAELAAGLITRLDTSAAAGLPGVHAVVTGADAPALSGMLVVKDQTVFAIDTVRYAGEPIAAVAAETPEQAAAALGAIVLELDPLAPVVDMDAAIAPDARLIHPDWAGYAAPVDGFRGGNVAWDTRLEKGTDEEWAAAFATAHAVVSDEFRTPRQHQTPLEPHACVARFTGGRYTVHTSTQFPHSVRTRTAELLGVRPSAIRVVVPTVGGGFGGKLDAMLEPIACLLARRSGRPVRLVNTRAEELATAGPRENAILRLRTAVDAEGRILAQESDVLTDNGANSSGETLICAGLPALALGSTYRVPLARYRTRVVYTNTAPTAAFRGVGGPYVVFAQESHLDHIAREIGVDRRELRLRNVLRAGEAMINGQVLDDLILVDALESVERRLPWKEERPARPGMLRGRAVVPLTWLTNPGPGEASVSLSDDGTILLTTAATEIGTGAVQTGVRQIVAERLGVNVEDVLVSGPDTDTAGFDNGAQGSRTTYGAGNAAGQAAGELRELIVRTAAGMLEAAEADLEIAGDVVRVVGSPGASVTLAAVSATAMWSSGPLSATGRFVSPPPEFDAGCMIGALFSTINATSSHAHTADVEVDPDTGEVTVLSYVVAQDVGRAINPAMIAGQVDGAVAQGVGYALYEDLRIGPDGQVLDRNLETYRIATALDVPPIDLEILESPLPTGPYGAKGVAEPPIVPVAAVLACAVSDAIGATLTELPLTPFAVLAALRAARP
ncbi:xanthine dehydrogenase family protein molybdopterin-binding subunit [Pseudonocardia sp. KRD-184]|uniref:Xanthine dehydrogenase family protein molybdopterin-binding subunit n=1 Tax=Pseudonocardia oceani TaxID=2792013 RepID=A0ABS6UBD6_9PSEU|nr:xanthine dehydrogenase family protein molybdopterin-binding subunit [Pseudonocardia oceani]MBW0096085.1 xanthine dehydrogenase family protein molybdopterin-binding subunit [Pseudonocardia oceani]MBW0108877.1 xanthine dehydrogenase family protein molybdopterin-binding subunit [Pseudonocardia oceani]MBW0122681.1 xanthine dehydrogenase family protein molybdopterin-binding subunit [Pseudonocardia oceani]MBW0129283.1 xanthine dehydrogenase family protein molybdopterin-binding subunit [Pseudonocar